MRITSYYRNQFKNKLLISLDESESDVVDYVHSEGVIFGNKGRFDE